MSSETEQRSFLERRTITFIVASIALIGWNIGVGVNLQAKLNDELVGDAERRALIFTAIVAFLTLCIVILAAAFELLAKAIHRHFWISSIQGEACWVIILTPLQFASSMVLAISRPLFTCPASPGRVSGSSCQGANDGLVVLSWIFPVIFITYLLPLILHTRRIAPIYPPVLKAAMWTVHWDDPGHYYELQSLERLSRWKNPSVATLPVYQPRSRDSDTESGISTNSLGINLGLAQQAPVVRTVEGQDRNPNLPRYSTIFPTRNGNNRTQTRGLRDLVLSQRQKTSPPRSQTQTLRQMQERQNNDRSLTRQGSTKIQNIQVLEVPTSFSHIPVPVIQPPPIARLWIRSEGEGGIAPTVGRPDARWYRPSQRT